MKKLLSLLLFVIPVLLLLFTVSKAEAAFRYPIKELDGCRNAKECALFCAIPKNTPACWSYYKYGEGSNILGVTAVLDKAAAVKLGITFPVEELGNCATPEACRDFCRDAENKAACTDFAVKKNLQKTKVKTIPSNVLKNARTELGCDTATSCHNFCRKPENQEMCKSFAEKFSLIKKTASNSTSINPDVISKAKNDLGCSTPESCKNLCESPNNKEKCRAFAAKYGLAKLSGRQKSAIAKEMIKSGLCANEVECAAYCQKNPTVCPGFATATDSAGTNKNKENVFLGPAGCRTEKECYEYCTSHPDECPNFPKKQGGFSEIPKTTPEKIKPTKRPEKTPVAKASPVAEPETTQAPDSEDKVTPTVQATE